MTDVRYYSPDEMHQADEDLAALYSIMKSLDPTSVPPTVEEFINDVLAEAELVEEDDETDS